jgi:hypothetical protein
MSIKWYNAYMRAEHLLWRGHPALMLIPLLGVFALNTLGLELTGGEPPEIGLKEVFGYPLVEELAFRLIPITIVAGLAASGAVKGPRTALIFGAVSSLVFGGYHCFDQGGEFVGQSLSAFAQRTGGGALLYYLAHKRGVGHSYAAHVGLNASIYASGSFI